MEWDKSSDECLAQKCMRKCRVESSTDSESETIENVGSHLSLPVTTQIASKKAELLRLQYLDPYDGDSEETSALSDSSTQNIFPSEDLSSMKDGPISMECSLDSVQNQQTSCDDCSLNLYQTDEVFLRSPTTVESPVEDLRCWQTSVRATSTPSINSDVAAETASLQSGHFVLFGVDQGTSKSTSSILPSSLTSEENSDFSMCEISMIKRKFGFKMDNEKLRRKKARVAEQTS
ncbi:uncharacterized protein [Hyperolius riggenbachi]|uniref:uncharacterized protein n=1 Tax=Hyperolius riggenbachi TaxID=752182 RepID=UPI0035A33D07